MSSVANKDLDMRKVVSSDEDSDIEVISELKVDLTKHQCDLCCKGNFLVGKLLQFGGVLTEECKFICDICDEGFKLETDLTSHRATHPVEEVEENGDLSENPLSATPFRYCNKTDLTKHKATRPVEENGTLSENLPSATPFLCHYCNNSYKHKNSLNRHVLKKHSTQS